MLRHTLLHPQLLGTLAALGHGRGVRTGEERVVPVGDQDLGAVPKSSEGPQELRVEQRVTKHQASPVAGRLRWPYPLSFSTTLLKSSSEMTDGSPAALAASQTLQVHSRIDAAYDRTSILEWTCKVWLAARAAGEPSVISDDDFSKVVEKLKGYGQRSRPATGEA